VLPFAPNSTSTSAEEQCTRGGLMTKLGDDVEPQMRETDLIELT
jgi:hypothetical protein